MQQRGLDVFHREGGEVLADARGVGGIRMAREHRRHHGALRDRCRPLVRLVQPGDPFNDERIDRSLKALFATGLFADVTLRRDGDVLVIHVVENPIINRIAFEGNSKLADKDLNGEIQPGGNPFEGPRSDEYPNKPLISSQAGLIFTKAAQSLGARP